MIENEWIMIIFLENMMVVYLKEVIDRWLEFIIVFSYVVGFKVNS